MHIGTTGIYLITALIIVPVVTAVFFSLCKRNYLLLAIPIDFVWLSLVTILFYSDDLWNLYVNGWSGETRFEILLFLTVRIAVLGYIIITVLVDIIVQGIKKASQIDENVS